MLVGRSNAKTTLERRRGARWTGLWLTVSLLAVAFLIVYQLHTSEFPRRVKSLLLPSPSDPVVDVVDLARETPLAIPRRSAKFLHLSDPELQSLTDMVRVPPGEGGSSGYLHWLRIHGSRSRLLDAGEEGRGRILGIFLHAELGEKYFGQKPLVRTRHGVRFRTNDLTGGITGRSEEIHRDQCLACFAELGIPLSEPITLGDDAFVLRDVLRDSVANFHLQQKEIAWTAIAYSLYLPPQRQWVNRYGERYSFDDLAEEFLRRPFHRASCGGTHLLYAMTVLLRADSVEPCLSEGTRESISRWLSQRLHAAIESQSADGHWTIPEWDTAVYRIDSAGDEPASQVDDRRRPARLLITGHLLEWMQLLPVEQQPPEHVYRRAVDWLVASLKAMSESDRDSKICPCTHAVCAIRNVVFEENGSRAEVR